MGIREVCKAWVYSPVPTGTSFPLIAPIRQLPQKENVPIRPFLSGVNYVQGTEQTLGKPNILVTASFAHMLAYYLVEEINISIHRKITGQYQL